jgi:hypothetical protein
MTASVACSNAARERRRTTSRSGISPCANQHRPQRTRRRAPVPPIHLHHLRHRLVSVRRQSESCSSSTIEFLLISKSGTRTRVAPRSSAPSSQARPPLLGRRAPPLHADQRC